MLLFLTSALLILLGFSGGGESCELAADMPDIPCDALQAKPYLTKETSNFANFIEGTAVDPFGNIYAVNYGDPNNTNRLGRVYPSQKLFYFDTLQGTLLNGIRFRNKNTAYVVDAVNHRVLELQLTKTDGETTVTNSSVFCSNQNMLQPNDLALSIKTGMVFTSGMRWLPDTDERDGDVHACPQDSGGFAIRLETMGRTNGIDLSPDENILYVSESYNRGGIPYAQKIWKYDVGTDPRHILSNKRIFADFGEIDGSVEVDIDGMKTDATGNLYVTRHGGSQVVIFSASGDVIGRIKLSFPNPTNLEFGGEKGTTLFIVGKCKDNEEKGCVDMIEMANPGRSYKLLTSSASSSFGFTLGIRLTLFISLVYSAFRQIGV